jgi:hypothetical protein
MMYFLPLGLTRGIVNSMVGAMEIKRTLNSLSQAICIICFLACLPMAMLAQPANDNCSNATTLTSGAAELCSQTTLGGSVESGEVVSGGCINNTFNQTVWYKFTATSDIMYIQIRRTGSAEGNSAFCGQDFAALLYNTNSCIPTLSDTLACKRMGSDPYLIIKKSGLAIGDEYLVQVGYRRVASGPNQCRAQYFCIEVGEYSTCATCQNFCGSACGFIPDPQNPNYPSVQDVVDNCPAYDLKPPLDGGETHTACYNFEALGGNADIGLVINSNCGGGPGPGGGGNVTSFSWELYEASCGAVIQSGSLGGNMTMTGLTAGQEYRICYTLTVPASCNHFIHYPYIVGATTIFLPLDIALSATYTQQSVYLEWTNLECKEASTLELEMGTDGSNFKTVKEWDCSGVDWLHSFKHREAPYGRIYYRVKATEPDGYVSYSNIASVLVPVGNDLAWNWTTANPLETDELNAIVSSPYDLQTTLVVSNTQGSIVLQMPIQISKGRSSVSAPLPLLPAGLYIVAVFGDHGPVSHWKFVKH